LEGRTIVTKTDAGEDLGGKKTKKFFPTTLKSFSPQLREA
jgi:hypothetical protein